MHVDEQSCLPSFVAFFAHLLHVSLSCCSLIINCELHIRMHAYVYVHVFLRYTAHSDVFFLGCVSILTFSFDVDFMFCLHCQIFCMLYYHVLMCFSHLVMVMSLHVIVSLQFPSMILFFNTLFYFIFLIMMCFGIPVTLMMHFFI